MECAGRGLGKRCVGPPTRRCGRCGAVSYCSVAHQISHWRYHKEECERLEQQMKLVDVLSDFPFTFTEEATAEIFHKRKTRCAFLSERGIHQIGLWKYECTCLSYDYKRFTCDGWHLPSSLCPCRGPPSLLQRRIYSWKDYYEWRGIPLNSPAALLLHWPLTVYHALQLLQMKSLISQDSDELFIHYLGPEKELLQLTVFAELLPLLPQRRIFIEFIGPAIPQHRDGEKINLQSFPHCTEESCGCKSSNEKFDENVEGAVKSRVTLQLHRGFYHNRYQDVTKGWLVCCFVSTFLPDVFRGQGLPPHLVIAPNAGIAAYPSWLPTTELIKELDVPAIFLDYCEEACHLATRCINTVIQRPLSLPIQLNPFRQPIAVEDSALLLPCYSNCFLYGI